MTVRADYAIGDILNQNLTPKLMYNEFLRDTAIMRITHTKKQGWRGGPIQVPFDAGEQSNYQSGGGLVPLEDIAPDLYKRGVISGYKYVHGALQFQARDLEQLGGGTMVPRDAFLQVKVAEKIQRNKARFKFNLSHAILNGGALVRATANLTANTITVNRPNNLTRGQKLVLQNTASGATPHRQEVWVQKINSNTRVVTLATDKTLGTAVALTPANYTLANAPVLFNPGDENPANRLTSLPDQILTAANGGSANLFGIPKTDHQFLQAINVDDAQGSNTREAVLDKIFDTAQTLIHQGQPATEGGNGMRMNEDGMRSATGRAFGSMKVLVSLEKVGLFKKYFRDKRESYFKVTKGKDLTFFDASRFKISTATDEVLDIIGVKSMPDDRAYFIGDDTLMFYTLNYMGTYKDPQGNRWVIERDNSYGWSFVTDFYLYGEYIVKRPAGCAALVNLKESSTITT